MVGHGIDQTFPGFAGLPSFVTTPRALEQSLKGAYLSVIGETTKAIGMHSTYGITTELEPSVFQVEQDITYTVYRQREDKVWAEDSITSRTFKVYTIHDYR